MEVDSDRHVIFKELKSTIRGSEKYLLVGVERSIQCQVSTYDIVTGGDLTLRISGNN